MGVIDNFRQGVIDLKNRVAAIGRVLKVLFDWLVRCYRVIAN